MQKFIYSTEYKECVYIDILSVRLYRHSTIEHNKREREREQGEIFCSIDYYTYFHTHCTCLLTFANSHSSSNVFTVSSLTAISLMGFFFHLYEVMQGSCMLVQLAIHRSLIRKHLPIHGAVLAVANLCGVCLLV